MSRKGTAVFLAALVVLHCWLFRDHYRGLSTFPWDFIMSYFGMVSYGNAMLMHGIVPDWMPYQSMGYPFLLNPQSGFFYPVFLVLGLLKIPYHLQVATQVQTLHLLAGALGAFVLTNRLTGNRYASLLAAIAYHFFGGFYSNAEHADIVRAYGYLPWLLWAVSPPRRSLDADSPLARGTLLGVLAAPLFLCALTGSYPGNVVAHFFLIGLYALLGLILAPRPERLLRMGMLLGPIAGSVMAAPMLLPVAFMRSVFQARNEGGFARYDWEVGNWPSVVLPWNLDGYVQDVSMRSAFIGVVIVAGICLLRRRHIAANRPLALFTAGALCLAPGAHSIIYRALSVVVPPLRLSRMSSSDYRGALCLGVILFGAMAIADYLAAGPEEQRELLRKRGPALVAVIVALAFGFWPVQVPGLVAWVVAVAVLATLGCLALMANERYAKPAAVLLLAVHAGSAMFVVNHAAVTWNAGGIPAWHQAAVGVDIDTQVGVERVFLDPPKRRPVREPDRSDVPPSWWGYLDGSYHVHDTGGFVLRSRNVIDADPVLKAWFLESWNGKVVPVDQAESCDLLKQRLEQSPSQSSAAVAPLKYTPDSIQYQVELPEPAVMIENEVFAPGWTAIAGDTPVESFSVCDSARAWKLPAGKYAMEATYRTPGLILGLRLTACTAVFLVVAALLARRAMVVSARRAGSPAPLGGEAQRG